MNRFPQPLFLLLGWLTLGWSSQLTAQTTLTTGDIAFVELKCDGAITPDRFSFFFLVDVDPGTQVRFTDAGWKTSGGILGENESGVITWTAPVAGVNAGVVVAIELDATGPAASQGTAVNEAFTGESGTVSLATSGDQVVAWQAPTLDRPTSGFLAAVSAASTNWLEAFNSNGTLDSNTSGLYPGLTDGVHAVSAGAGPGAQDEFDNVKFDPAQCASLSGDPAAIRAIIYDDANWLGEDDESLFTAFTASTGCNNFTVGVNAPPTLTCPANDTVFRDTGLCDATLLDYTGQAIVVDDTDPNPTLTQSPSPSFSLPTGTTTVTIIATDFDGASDTCQFAVTVADTVAPAFTACTPDQSLAADSSCGAVLPDYTSLATVLDGCGDPFTLTQSPAPGAFIDSDTVITLTVVDTFGNSSICAFNLTLTGTGADSTFLTTTTTDPAQVGADTTTLVNQVGCDSLVITTTVLANMPPMLTCPANDTVFRDEGFCDATLLDYTGQAIVVDDTDPNPTLTQSPAPSPPFFPLAGITIVTIIATDFDGASDTCQFAVTVTDTVAPAFTACTPDQSLAADSSCGAVLPDYTSLATVLDGCGDPFTLTQSPAPGAFIDSDTVITLTVVDTFGNASTCTFLLTLTGTAPDTTALSAGSCDPMQVGVDTTLLVNQAGCDSLVIATTTLLPSDTTALTATTTDATQVGVDTVTLANQFGCDSLVITTTVFDSASVGIVSPAGAARVYPNPTQGWITMELAESAPPMRALIIRDLQGRLISRETPPQPATRFRLDLSAQPQGMYLLEVQWEGQPALYQMIRKE